MEKIVDHPSPPHTFFSPPTYFNNFFTDHPHIFLFDFPFRPSLRISNGIALRHFITFKVFYLIQQIWNGLSQLFKFVARMTDTND